MSTNCSVLLYTWLFFSSLLRELHTANRILNDPVLDPPCTLYGLLQNSDLFLVWIRDKMFQTPGQSLGF